MEYEVVIGLEVHLQLKTETKMFCGCRTSFGARPNAQTCPGCLGLPGTLPVFNKKALEYAIVAALALNCQIFPSCKFHRKSYFYPDLPRAYQISQYDEPLAKNGYLEILTNGHPRRIGINRLNLEEDAGKLIHTSASTLVDYNRSGMPLIEIVSKPELFSPDEAYLYLLELKAILQYTEVSDCNMEEGSLRCDANLSLRPIGKEGLGTRVEVKNMNTFKGVRAALNFEIERQKEILQRGELVIQETRLWNPDQAKTISMRTKEEAHDYRYYPEPDLVPIVVSKEWIDEVRGHLPELPGRRRERFVKEHGLPIYDAEVLTQERSLADFYEECLKLYPKPKILSNWIMTELLAYLSECKKTLSGVAFPPEHLTRILQMIDEGTISGKMAKEVFKEVTRSHESPEEVIQKRGFIQIADEERIKEIVEQVLKENEGAAKDFQEGKEKAFTYLVGQAMRLSKGKANPELVNRLLRERLAL